MKTKQSIIGGLDRMMPIHEASAVLQIPVPDLEHFFRGRTEISLRNLLKRICRDKPTFIFPIIGKRTYTLEGVMKSVGMGRSWCLDFLGRHNISFWCIGVHYLYAKDEVDHAWSLEYFKWADWAPLIDTVNAFSLDVEQVIEKIALGQVRVLDKGRGQVVSLKDIRKIWKRAE